MDILQNIKQHKALEVNYSVNFMDWLKQSQSSIVLTSYDTHNIFFISYSPNKNLLRFFSRNIPRCMGITLNKNELYISSLYQIHYLLNTPSALIDYPDCDKLYAPRLSYITGDIDTHDMAITAEGKLVFINTAYNCLATVSNTHSFKPLWCPKFISNIIGEDRCHLNGLAMVEGKPKYVTAVSTTDVCDGWREHMKYGGVIIDIETDEIICRNLSMPHSPRFYKNKLWLLNSGTGYFGYIENKQFVPMTFCPGFTRGLSFIDNCAIVGISRLRQSHISHATNLSKNLREAGIEACTGIQIIDLQNGEILHWIQFSGWLTEIYDVALLQNVKMPMVIGFESSEIENTITIE